MKKCERCQIEKRLVYFNKSKCYPDGYQPHCRDCGFQIRLDGGAKLPTLWEVRERETVPPKRKAARGRKSSARALEEAQAKSYVASVQARTRCGQCDRLGVIFYHPARDRGGKILVAGFTTMSEIDGRIEDMVPLCLICKPLIEKCKIQTTLFD